MESIRPDPSAAEADANHAASVAKSRLREKESLSKSRRQMGRKQARKLTAFEQQARAMPMGVYTWGRGAHGRLGHGRNDTLRHPSLIRRWPDSFDGFFVVRQHSPSHRYHSLH